MPYSPCKFLIKILSFLLILLAGCKYSTADNRKDNDTKQSADSLSKSDLTIGLSMYTLSAPYFMAQAKAVGEEVTSRGMEFIYLDAQNDMVRQVGNVEDLLARGIDLLILNPLDPHGLIPATRSATRAGVPVVIIDSSIDPSADFITIIQSNNLRNGELVGEWLVKQMGSQEIKAAMLSGAPGNPVGKERRQGMIRGITEQQFRSEGEVHLDLVAQGWGNWTYEGGLAAMEDILVAHSDINVLVSEQDAMALGALQAIREAGKAEDILVVAAADGQKEAFEKIRTGEYGATGLNNPVLIAEMAVDVAVRVLAGETDFPQVIYTPAVCINKENVDEYYDPDAIF